MVGGLDFGKGVEDDGDNDDEGDEKHEGSVSSGEDGNGYNDTCNIHCKGCDFQGLGGGVLHHGLAFRLGEVFPPSLCFKLIGGLPLVQVQTGKFPKNFWTGFLRLVLAIGKPRSPDKGSGAYLVASWLVCRFRC